MQMTLSEIQEILNAMLLSEYSFTDIIIERAYCADLMSDVLAFSSNNFLLITHLTNAQVIRTGVVAGINAIVFVENKKPTFETIALADKEKIPLIATTLSMFDTCGKLYERGLRSIFFTETQNG